MIEYAGDVTPRDVADAVESMLSSRRAIMDSGCEVNVTVGDDMIPHLTVIAPRSAHMRVRMETSDVVSRDGMEGYEFIPTLERLDPNEITMHEYDAVDIRRFYAAQAKVVDALYDIYNQEFYPEQYFD
jgi:hypothetical protein